MMFTCDVCGKTLRPGRVFWDYYPPRKKDASARYTRIVPTAGIAVGMYCSKKCLYNDTIPAKMERFRAAKKGIQRERGELPGG